MLQSACFETIVPMPTVRPTSRRDGQRDPRDGICLVLRPAALARPEVLPAQGHFRRFAGAMVGLSERLRRSS